MREASDYFQDWGPWGWLWALGLYVFLLGLLLVPLAMAGQVPAVLFLASLPGAVLMRASGESTRERFRSETNI
ncbi:MAG: hypothetical protein V3W28_02560 [Thermoplasmata archaeon]